MGKKFEKNTVVKQWKTVPQKMSIFKETEVQMEQMIGKNQKIFSDKFPKF